MYRNWMRMLREADLGKGAAGAGEGDWRAALPEDMRADAAFASFTDVAGLAKSYRETKALVGASIRPPGPDAGPEAKKAFREAVRKHAPELLEIPEDPKARAEVEGDIWARLGRPKEATAYAAEGVELPQGFDLDGLRAQALELGLTKAQFASLAKKTAEAHLAQTAERAKVDKALRAEWGAAYEERVAAAKAVAAQFGVPAEAVAAMPATQMKAFYAAAKAVGVERGEVGGQDGGGAGKLSPSEAELQIAEIRGRKEYWDRSINPVVHEHLKKKLSELARMAYPDD